MKPAAVKLPTLFVISISIFLFSCSKSSNNPSTTNTTTTTGTALFPLAVNDSWSYKLKNYDTAKGTVTDSSYFTLSISGTTSANGATYYQFQNSPDTMVLSTLAAVNSTTLGSISNQYGTNYHTFFASGSGDSTQIIDSWPVGVSENGNSCQGTDKLFGHYSDTTLVNLDGTVYANSMKNIIVTYDCSGIKMIANVYFIKQGVGLVRYSKYIYNASGKPLLQLAWVLESETLH